MRSSWSAADRCPDRSPRSDDRSRRHRHPAPWAPPPPRPRRDRRCCPRTSRGVRDRRGTDRRRRWATPSSGRSTGAGPSPRSHPPRRSPSQPPERCHRRAGPGGLGRRGGRATRTRAPSPGRSRRRHPRHRRGAPTHAPGPRARPRPRHPHRHVGTPRARGSLAAGRRRVRRRAGSMPRRGARRPTTCRPAPWSPGRRAAARAWRAPARRHRGTGDPWPGGSRAGRGR